MKKFLIFLTLALCVWPFGEMRPAAQTADEKKFFVEMKLPDETIRNLSHKYEIPPDFDFEKSLIGAGYATVDCLDCPMTSEYRFWIFKAQRRSNGKVELGVIAEFENKPACNVQKEFVVDPHKKETIDLKCGVKVVTYSAFPKKTDQIEKDSVN